MIRSLNRSIVTAGISIGLGIALQPLYAEPSLHTLAVQAGELLIRGGVSLSAGLACAYCIHKIKSWAGDRPTLPAPSQLFAVSQSLGPSLAGEVARAQAEERSEVETDPERESRLAVIRFCIIGESRRTFGYESMRGNVDRPTWDLLTKHLSRSKVLRIGAGTRPTWFREGWSSVRVRVALKRGDLEIPPLPKSGPPVVVWSDYRQATHTAKQANKIANWRRP